MLSRVARIAQTAREIERLEEDIRTGIEERRKLFASEERRPYESQLKALEAYFTRQTTQLPLLLATHTAEKDAVGVYPVCRQLDRTLVWIRQVWDYFRSRFDQRKEETLSPVLRAADELVWACWRIAWDSAGEADKRPAPPMPCIEPMYSPAAATDYLIKQGTLKLPGSLARQFPGLAATVESLPVPLLYLPPWVLHSPWWLILIAHEVGHHIRPYFREEGVFESHLRDGGGLPEPESWVDWGEEIFADMYSVLLLGPWAIQAIAELEYGSQQQMSQRKQWYPPTVVRLSLMCSTLERINESEHSIKDDVKIPCTDSGELGELCAAVPKIVERVLAQPPFNALMSVTLPWNQHPESYWSDQLRQPDCAAITGDIQPEMVRSICLGAYAAWVDISGGMTGDSRDTHHWQTLTTVETNACARMQEAAEEGVRSGEQIENDVTKAISAADSALGKIDTLLFTKDEL